MAMVAAGIANHGDVMKPYLVDEVQSPELDVLRQAEPERASGAPSVRVDRRRADQDDGRHRATTAPRTGARSPASSVAGKTGTAQSGRPDVPPYAWFISFAPADDPQVAVAVMIQQADIPRGEIAGGQLGGPIAKAVMEAVLQ